MSTFFELLEVCPIDITFNMVPWSTSLPILITISYNLCRSFLDYVMDLLLFPSFWYLKVIFNMFGLLLPCDRNFTTPFVSYSLRHKSFFIGNFYFHFMSVNVWFFSLSLINSGRLTVILFTISFKISDFLLLWPSFEPRFSLFLVFLLLIHKFIFYEK